MIRLFTWISSWLWWNKGLSIYNQYENHYGGPLFWITHFFAMQLEIRSKYRPRDQLINMISLMLHFRFIIDSNSLELVKESFNFCIKIIIMSYKFESSNLVVFFLFACVQLTHNLSNSANSPTIDHKSETL